MTFFSRYAPLLGLLLVAGHALARPSGEDVFRFHVPNEPSTLDPARMPSTDANYLFHNLYRGLYRWTSGQKLVPEGATECVRTEPLKIICTLRSDAKWSNGQDIVADDYVRAFRHLVSPASRNLGVELLQNVVGVMESFSGRQAPEKIGVKALAKRRLEIRLLKPDPDFIYKLTSPLLVPIASTQFPERKNSSRQLFSGPYKIERWETGKKVRMIPNPYYKRGFATRPTVEVFFVDEDSTALTLYEEGRLSFLRRLPTAFVRKYKARPDFKQIPMARFDYVGFGPALKDQPQLRKALALSLKFDELRMIYDALGIPGCPSLPEEYMTEIPCHSLNEKEAKAAWDSLSPEAKTARYTLAFSKLGGDDIKKGAEWLQQQWRKRLNAKIDLEQTEQGVYLEKLRENAPPLFRKGVGLDRPTCLAALETFAPGGSENFIQLNLPEYNKVIEKLGVAKSASEMKALCTEGVRILVDGHWIIPLGRIHFRLLAKPKYQGWELNEMNQLDLAELRVSPGAK